MLQEPRRRQSVRLENKIIDLIKNTAKTETGTDTTAKVLRVENGVAWVHIDGGAEETPVYETIACSPGDMVNVRISKGTAFLVGNGTAPPTDDTEAIIANIKAVSAQKTADVAKYIANLSVGILEANKLTAQTVIVQDLLTAKKAIVQTATVTDLSGAIADFSRVIADMLNAGTITAEQATIIRTNFTTAIGDSLTVGEIDAKKAVFAGLTSDVVEANVLSSLVAEFDRAAIDWLNVKRLDAAYANIDGANILEAFIGQVFNKNAMIEDAIVTTLDATGRITAVRINADYINANTLKANRIIFLGTDGLFHQLNESGETSLPDQTGDNSLNGSVITASSITADKLTVTDLSAFGADIAGLKLEDSSIHTYGKDSPYSTVEGWYIGTAEGAGGIQDNDGDVILSYDGRDFDARSEMYNGFTIGNATEYLRFAGGILEIKSSNLDANFLKRSEYLTQTEYTFGRRASGSEIGDWSIAEGKDNIASEEASHAEGIETAASGSASHSEGYRTTASGNAAHAEGNGTVASGDYSHAEGLYTSADSAYQTVIGRNNRSDPDNRYAFIIGGGGGAIGGSGFIFFNATSLIGINLKGFKITIDTAPWDLPEWAQTIGREGIWIMRSTTGVTKTLYQPPGQDEEGEPIAGFYPIYRYAADDCEVSVPPSPSTDYDLDGVSLAQWYDEVIWNPTTDFIVSAVNRDHPLFPYLKINLIPSTAQVIADL